MDHLFDEFSKSLNESVPRRESLRRLGAVFAGALLAPLGVGAAWAGQADRCKTYCSKCRTKAQQSQCITACRACNGDTGRLAGSCSKHVCCPVASCRGACSDLKSDPNCGACGNDCRVFGETCCGGRCADLENDIDNCGGCGNRCDAPGQYETVACASGTCIYDCLDGATDCGNGTCTYLGDDPDNCGACGNVCPASEPYCDQGACTANVCSEGGTMCGGQCIDTWWDALNCGACGWRCNPQDYCAFGVCTGVTFDYGY